MMWCYTVTTTYTGMSLWCHDYELEQTQYPKYSTVLNLITTVMKGTKVLTLGAGR